MLLSLLIARLSFYSSLPLTFHNCELLRSGASGVGLVRFFTQDRYRGVKRIVALKLGVKLASRQPL